ncbi:Uu.00g065630.m01.CDS01 [Anthostomella pinea]|uniref:Uu.00g065630.m01.CDS01 n=1 Tax=Anthostomella pinea TaxID=933095 RepID=A0AAI8YN66_9PEZI|nr:Uu.00g065630.m01.CDS01 [Anthostomella pinea]
MDASPLTQQARPDIFQPKIVQLYEVLFKVREFCIPQSYVGLGIADNGTPSDQDLDVEPYQPEGFWREFFLLNPDQASLQRILAELGPDHLINLQPQTRQLFFRAVACLKKGGGIADLHALETLTTFFSAILPKKYTNPSSDIIAVLAGLDQVDTVFTDFVGALDGIIRNGKTLDVRRRAVEVVLSITSGAYQTSLLTYFIHRDLFPAIMKFIQESESPSMVLEPFTLLGLLANYNKFEFQNPYQQRLNDFVNEAAIQKIIKCVGQTSRGLRGQYIEILQDLPEGWSISNTLSMIGLGAIAPGSKANQKPTYDPEVAKQMFAKLPGEEAAVLLGTYDFSHANKLFCFNLVTLPADKGEEQPISSFLSLTSYLLQHAFLSNRATNYAHLSLMIFRLLIEDQLLCKRICSEESKVAVRLCRQRQPYLPAVKGERILATSVLDTMIDGINHNLRRRLDYHWSELFRSLLSLVRFLTTYASDLKDLQHFDTLLDLVVNLLALSLSAGEAFLPTPAAYDDLFYKVVENGDVLEKFRDTYKLSNRASNSIGTLVSVSTHYKSMLDSGGSRKNLTSSQVAEVIKQGYETLSIQAKEGLDGWERYREADERNLLKKVARASVNDVKIMVQA